MSGNPEFGALIRALREAKKRKDPDFSLRKFATAIGISATFLSKVETGEFAPPAPERIIKMAELLGQNPDELLALADKHAPDLSEIIKDKPKAMADFLRTVKETDLPEEELRKLTQQIRDRKE